MILNEIQTQQTEIYANLRNFCEGFFILGEIVNFCSPYENQVGLFSKSWKHIYHMTQLYQSLLLPPKDCGWWNLWVASSCLNG